MFLIKTNKNKNKQNKRYEQTHSIRLFTIAMQLV